MMNVCWLSQLISPEHGSPFGRDNRHLLRPHVFVNADGGLFVVHAREMKIGWPSDGDGVDDAKIDDDSGNVIASVIALE